MLNTDARILAALQLAPMTAAELSRCLAISYETANTHATCLLDRRWLKVVGYIRHTKFGLAARRYAAVAHYTQGEREC